MMEDKILGWAKERSLLKSENQWKQLAKLSEEVGELSRAMLKKDIAEQIDSLGDCVIVLTILANQLGFSLGECTKKAYKVIENREGKTIDGTFIKN